MTDERLAEIKQADLYSRNGLTYQPTMREELVAALELERARLDWLIRYLETPEDDRIPWFVVMIGVPETERAEKWRESIDSAMKGAGR